MDRGLKLLQSILITVVLLRTLIVANSEWGNSFAAPTVLRATPSYLLGPASPAVLPSLESPASSPDEYSFPPDIPSAPAVLPLPESPLPNPNHGPSSLPPEPPYSTAVPPLPDPPVPAPASLEPPAKSSPRFHSPPRAGVKAAYWPSFGSFQASKINTSYFTHVYYAFLLPSPTTYELNLTSRDLTKIPELIQALKNKTPRAKTLLSIGGGGN